MNPLAADKRFFNALIAGDAQALDRILTDDFILIGVMSGSEITKPAFLAGIGSEQVKFEAIEPADNRVRLDQTTAIITGRTQMKGRLGDAPFAARSRYIHVFVSLQNEWRLATAQGTQISPPPGQLASWRRAAASFWCVPEAVARNLDLSCKF